MGCFEILCFMIKKCLFIDEGTLGVQHARESTGIKDWDLKNFMV